MLAAGTFAQAGSAVAIHGPAFLIPTLHRELGYSLAAAGAVAAAPTVGVMVTLVAWGLFVDRYGERLALGLGLAGTAACSVLAVLTRDRIGLLVVAIGLAGAFAASSNAASGRVVVGWFPPERRGLAMGIRQMAQPMGVGIGAVGIAVIAESYGVASALWLPAAITALGVVAVLLTVIDPPRPDRRTTRVANPYREDAYLARVHGVSMLLVVPQFLVWTFSLAWLVDDRGWSAGAAGAVVAVAQVVGALGRIAVGAWSDRAGGRMGPLRLVAVGAAASMLLLGLTAGLDWAVAVALMVVATAVTVADNGLAFTAVAERAGPFWSGRALGLQNTGQFLVASAVPPVTGLAVAGWGYPAAFAAAAVFPLLAIALVPVRDEAPPS
ncbi:putative major facilitator superfamily protein [Marmoricola endophyticus]|uniref:Major facilitator superfamily protein n=2 Tax=Marmoricola endophyticus TaxID=2040280 RepID=A0A917BIN1_9ACTN|nr:putative major facilitator superfamily protein [Marmoricola endophyticus]